MNVGEKRRKQEVFVVYDCQIIFLPNGPINALLKDYKNHLGSSEVTS